MKTIIVENPAIIKKNKSKLEKELNINITSNEKNREIIIDGEAEDEYLAEKIIDVLNFGFPFSAAMLIKKEDFLFEIIDIKHYTKRENLRTVRARIIGRGGKTLRVLHDLTKCYVEIKENHIAIIGDPEYIQNCQEAIISLIRGSKHSNVYAFLEKHQVQPIFDFGLKPLKSKRKNRKKNKK